MSAATCAPVASIVFAITLSFNPGSSVATRPARSGRNGWSFSAGGPWRARASARSSRAPGTAKGMILTVATISRAATTAWLGSVPIVIASSTALMRSIFAVSTTSRPAVSALRLTRPVAARLRERRGETNGSARRSAQMSSGTSPGSSRATMTSATPAFRSAVIAASSSTDPLRIMRSARRWECALIAPLASARGTGPNLTRLASWREPRHGGRRQSRRGSRARSRGR